MSQQGTIGVKALLLVLGLLGVAANALVFVDAQWWNYWLIRPEKPPYIPSDEQEKLRQSILFVYVPTCDGQGFSTGTGFVVASGYVVTCAHVVQESTKCSSGIRLIDAEGREHNVNLDGFSEEDDLALLRISNSSIPALTFADSTPYRETETRIGVYTVGYPLVGAASDPGKAAFSGLGSISSFHKPDGLFITSGLNMNPGNSGGPVFLESEQKVLGVAVKKLDVNIGEGIGYAIPAETVRRFFKEKTGQPLPEPVASPGETGDSAGPSQ